METYFQQIPAKIEYEGRDSKNPLAFRWYNKEQVIMGKTMEEHLRFAIAYWHTFKNTGDDPFGDSVMDYPWSNYTDPISKAYATCDAAFEFFSKLGVPYYCFHDRDIAPEGETFSESCKNLELLVMHAAKLQEATGIKLLWGTANLFNHPRYTHGAGTNPDFHVFSYAAAQVKHAIAATKELGGENYVFWGGREGYETLLNTKMKKEQEQMAAFFHMCVKYAEKIGFSGQFLIEPKPKEPTKHQYDFDASTVLNFLRTYDLIDHFKLNIEANHATLAGHTFEHELAVAIAADRLGSVDINRGDLLLGWDTDQFPTNLYSTTYAMLQILSAGGLGSGGLNFDAKVRRGSKDTADLFHGHIGGMDAFARGLTIAATIIEDGFLEDFKQQRYSSWQEDIAIAVLEGRSSLAECEAYIQSQGEPTLTSGRQEYLENIINTFI
ncbi:MAG: xylose isomerase [Desulfobacteraceae bacterium]|jgi:xylose isomerase